MNDLTNCSRRRFNVDIMMLYISARDHARKLKFNNYVHLLTVNCFHILSLSDYVQCRRGHYF